MIFESRKSLFLHRRKLHPSLPKIKSEASSTSTISETGIKGEPFKPTAGDLVPKTEQVISIYLFQKYYVLYMHSKGTLKTFILFIYFCTFQFADLLPNANGEYTCDRCDRAFKDKELLFRHAACHDEEKPFECLECGKKFAKAGLLRDHRKRHFEVGAFECGYCKKRFYTPNKVFWIFFRFPCYRIYLIPIIFTQKTYIKIFIRFSFANMSVFIPEKLLFHARTAESVSSAIATYLNINEYTWKIVQSSLPNNYSVIVER